MQSPFDTKYNYYVKARPNLWAVPCDNIIECENGEDEAVSLCIVKEGYTFYSLLGGFLVICFAMLTILFYKKKRYIPNYTQVSSEIAKQVVVNCFEKKKINDQMIRLNVKSGLSKHNSRF